MPPVQRRRIGGARTLAEFRSGAYDPLDKRTKAGKARHEKREFMELARERYAMADDADEKQLAREKSDLAFYAGEQWPADVKLSRAGAPAANGLPPIPARPCLVINKVREPVSQVLSALRDADISGELVPADDFEGLGVVLDDTEITLREGMLRRILRESQASIWIYSAAERAAIAGRGYMGVMTRYAPGKTNDQELFVTGWFDQSCVRLDPSHERKDGADIKYAFSGVWMKLEDYKLRWPGSENKRNMISEMSDKEFTDFGADDEAKPWFRTSGKLRMVYVVDYFYTVETKRELCTLADGTVEWKDELSDDADVIDTRDVIECTVKWAKLDGANPEPLEETDWITSDIPIVKVVGDQLQPFDDQVRCEGLVRPARDSNEGFNAMASKLVEDVAYAPTDAPYVAAGQMEGFEEWWKLRTTRRLPAIPYNYKDSEGQNVGPPQHPNSGTNVQPLSMALAMFDEAVQTTSRRHDPSLGKVDPTLRSGRAITQIIDQSKEGTSNFGDNLRLSVRRLVEILNNCLYPVYGTRPGRLAKIINGENKAETVMLGQPYVMDGKRVRGLTVPHPEKAGQHMPMPIGHAMANGAKQYSLSEHANSNISIKITRAYETRREEEQAMLGQIAANDPSQLAIMGDLLFAHSDGPGSKELAQRYRLVLAPPIQAALAAKDGKMTPEQMAQQLAEAKQMLQMAQQEIQGLQQKLQGKVVEQEGKLKVTEVQEAAETDRADKDREAKLAVAALQAKVQTLETEMALFIEERKRLGAHAATLQEHAHDAAERGKDRIHNIIDAQLSHGHVTAQNEQVHQHTLEQTAHEAALAPEPTADEGM